MRIGIKYCGGCNPFYDRKAEVEKLEQNLKDIRFEPVQHGGNYDRLLLVCGCPRACIWKQHVSRKYGFSGGYAASGKYFVSEMPEHSGTTPEYLLAKSREDFIKVQEWLQDGD